MATTEQTKATQAIEDIRHHVQSALDLLYGLPGEVALPEGSEQEIERQLVTLLGQCRMATTAIRAAYGE